jgi:hypothetical protein
LNVRHFAAPKVAALESFSMLSKRRAIIRSSKFIIQKQVLMQYDLLLAVRTLLRNPGFTCVAALALALGIGVNTAIFSVVNAVLLRALPYNEANRLVLVWSPNAELAPWLGEALPPGNGDYTDWRKRNHVFSSMAAFRTAPLNLSQDGQTDRAAGVRVSAHFFDTLQVKPLMGRTFTEDDDQPGKKLVVLTETLWRNRFAADPRIVGRDITLDSDRYKVIGVMPKTFRFPLGAEMPAGSAFADPTT